MPNYNNSSYSIQNPMVNNNMTNSPYGSSSSTLSNYSPQINPNSYSSFFPQPQGSVYLIGSSPEVNNIPITNGLSATICLSEGTLFIKTLQNGNPSMIGYKLLPLDAQASISQSFTQNTTKEDGYQEFEQKVTKVLKSLDERLSLLENAKNNTISSGAKEDDKSWQI